MRFDDFFHVLNPSAHHRDAVRQFFDKNKNLRCAWVERQSHPTHLETVLNWALVEGHHRLAIWGGDGTLSRCVQFLHESGTFDKITLALLPAGTCNDFHRKISGGVPLWKLDFNGAAVETAFDVGLLETGGVHRTFINNAGFGRTKAATKTKRSTVRDILSLTEKTIQLEWNDGGHRKTQSQTVLLGVICNSPFFNCGLHFDKHGSPNDQLLDGHFELPHSRLGLLWKFVKGRKGVSLSDKHTFSVSSSQIRMTSDQDVYPQVDGEPASDAAVRSLTFSIVPKAVKFLVWKGSK